MSGMKSNPLLSISEIILIMKNRDNFRLQPHGEVLQSREAEMVRKFMNLLKRNFVKQKLVIEYAGQLCVTPNYLNRVVKKVTGLTASHHIQQQIIMEAKRQAMYSQVSMKEIAYGLGFDNLAHFSKYFKTNSGINFTDFKRQAKDHLVSLKKVPTETDHAEI
jgi:AraC family transcriptional activator of pobA